MRHEARKEIVVAIDKLHPLTPSMTQGQVAGCSLTSMGLDVERDVDLGGKLLDHGLGGDVALVVDHDNLIVGTRQALRHDATQAAAHDVLLQSSVFYLNYDVGHNACTGGGDEALILSRAEKLRHMHLHDAHPETKQDHMPLGTGKLNIPRLIHLMRDGDKSVVIEVKTEDALRRSVSWLRQEGIMA